VKILSYNHSVFYVISGMLLMVALTSVAMTTIQQVLAADKNSQIVKVSISRGPQDKFLTDKPVVSQAGSNKTTVAAAANTTGRTPTSPTANPIGTSQSSLHPEEPQPSAHPASREGRIWPPSSNPAGSNITGPAANMTGGAPGSPPTANPAGAFDYNNQDHPHG
jgi:hypothetical protein